MMLFAAMVWHPGGVVAWIVVGMVTGWLANYVVGEGAYGPIADIVLAAVGGVVGGFVHGMVKGDAGGGMDSWFWGSIGLAFLGACVLLAGGRFVTMSRQS
jgi:uncharacterized membrane protein YeaQ/YmgE (transglycosylase-associated protein family)